MTTDDWASSQASATCWALTPRVAAMSREGGVLLGQFLGVRQPAQQRREEGQAEASQTSISGRLLRKAWG